MLAPELVDETLGRDRLVRAQEQQRQHGALIPAAQADGVSFVEHLEWPEDPELQHSRVVTGHTTLLKTCSDGISATLGPRECAI